jgi:hypothetical protein
MNEDFSRTNADTSNTPADFRTVAGNPNFQFCLAQRDPSGKPTTGIIRVETKEDGFDDRDDGVKSKATGGDDAWDVTRYYNIWICNFNDPGTLGYAEFPLGTASNTFGYVGSYLFTGTTSNVAPPFNKGRTTTHEVGHTFNLNHIWGDDGGACTGTDDCADTPNQGKENYNRPTFPLTDSCTKTAPGIMFMNFMDYTDDDVMNMFTKDQATRMNAVLNIPPYNTLLSSNACSVVTGTDEIETDTYVIIYPNPTSGNFSLSFNAIEKLTYVIELRNALGQPVYKEEISNLRDKCVKDFHFDGMAKGVYTVSIAIGKQQQIVRKLVVVVD